MRKHLTSTLTRQRGSHSWSRSRTRPRTLAPLWRISPSASLQKSVTGRKRHRESDASDTKKLACSSTSNSVRYVKARYLVCFKGVDVCF